MLPVSDYEQVHVLFNGMLDERLVGSAAMKYDLGVVGPHFNRRLLQTCR